MPSPRGPHTCRPIVPGADVSGAADGAVAAIACRFFASISVPGEIRVLGGAMGWVGIVDTSRDDQSFRLSRVTGMDTITLVEMRREWTFKEMSPGDEDDEK